MTARAIRRAAERKAAKQLRKQLRNANACIPGETIQQTITPPPADQHLSRDLENETVERTLPTCSKAAAPPARHYTGPTTAEGKAISSLNRLKHGLTGLFRVLEFESQKQFDELRDALRAEHVPATPTETLLVDRMAEHIWLSQRAQRLQDEALLNTDERRFSLFLRYQTTNDRAFHKCLRELATLRQERRQFESQKQKAALPLREREEQEGSSNRKMTAVVHDPTPRNESDRRQHRENAIKRGIGERDVIGKAASPR